MKKIIHVNRHKIASNSKRKKMEPVLCVKTYKSNDYCNEVEILGPSKLVYTPDKPLSCGAKCYIVTHAEVRMYKNVKKVRGSCPLNKLDLISED